MFWKKKKKIEIDLKIGDYVIGALIQKTQTSVVPSMGISIPIVVEEIPLKGTVTGLTEDSIKIAETWSEKWYTRKKVLGGFIIHSFVPSEML
jgi:hypothetical protein